MKNKKEELGDDNRAQYLQELSEKFDVDHREVRRLALLLGPREDFGKLIDALNEYYND